MSKLFDAAKKEFSITAKITAIRDGTHGISITMADRLLGEWPDSMAESLVLTDDLRVYVCGKLRDRRYLLTMPGLPLRGEQVSPTEVLIVTRT
jgi:hypothetical protein